MSEPTIARVYLVRVRAGDIETTRACLNLDEARAVVLPDVEIDIRVMLDNQLRGAATGAALQRLVDACMDPSLAAVGEEYTSRRISVCEVVTR